MRTDPAEVHGGTFDVLVIGGGITGAAIAREAAVRGATTLLVERDDFASGASSRTSRMIQGGLSGFQAGRVAEVREAVAERERLLRLAPHLVRPLPLLRPCFDDSPESVFSAERGLQSYGSLARRSTLPAPRQLDADSCARLFPALNPAGLRGGVAFYEAAANDTRLTLAVLEAARTAGAALCSYLEVVGERDGRVRMVDSIAEREIEVRCGRIFNAAGGGVDAVRRALAIAACEDAVEVRESTLVWVDPIDTEVGLLAVRSDGELQCAVPHPDGLLCGGGQDAESVLAELAPWLREPLALADVGSHIVASRVSPLDRGSADISENSAAGDVVSILRPRLATHRSHAESVVGDLASGGGPSPTRTMPLPGGDGPRDVGDPLWWRHGSRAWEVRSMANGDPSALDPVCPHRSFLGVEVLFAARVEGAVTFDDVALRRLVDARGPCTEESCLRRLHQLYAQTCPATANPDFDFDRDRLLAALR